MVTVDAIAFSLEQDSPEVLLIQRKNEPFKNMWAFPGGFVEMDEDLIDAAKRELKEETSLTGINLQQLQTFGKPGRDPRGRQITIVFFGIVKSKTKIKAGDDASAAKWYKIENLAKLAFDHNEILQIAIDRLKQTDHYITWSKQKTV